MDGVSGDVQTGEYRGRRISMDRSKWLHIYTCMNIMN